MVVVMRKLCQLSPNQMLSDDLLSRAFLHEALRRDFKSFIEFSFDLVYPGQDFVDNWHIDVIAHELSSIALGHSRRLIITLPPRHLKSFMASVAFPAWVLGNWPGKKIICSSYSAELASVQTRLFRNLVGREPYQALFPNMRISRGANTDTEQGTTRNGSRVATSVGGTLTGRGGDIVIIDDPIKTDVAMSEAERNNVNNWFDASAITRLDRQNEGAIIIVMQRLHEDDLVGHLLVNSADDWVIVDIPARAPIAKTYRARDSWRCHTVEPGEVLCPELISDERLIELERIMGRGRFSAQYLQQPVPFDGNIIKKQWLSSYDEIPPREHHHAIVQSWDTAIATGTSNDYSVCTTWCVSPMGLYLLDVFRDKLEFADLLRKAATLASQFRANQVLIEGAASGTSLYQTLRGYLKNAKLQAITPVQDKEARLRTCSHMFENGLVKLPSIGSDANWLDAFRYELLGFPAGRHDDQVDSTSQFLNYIADKTVGGFRYDQSGNRVHSRRPDMRSVVQKYGAWTPQ